MGQYFAEKLYCRGVERQDAQSGQCLLGEAPFEHQADVIHSRAHLADRLPTVDDRSMHHRRNPVDGAIDQPVLASPIPMPAIRRKSTPTM